MEERTGSTLLLAAVALEFVLGGRKKQNTTEGDCYIFTGTFVPY